MDYGENRPGWDYLDGPIADYKWERPESQDASTSFRQTFMPDYAKRSTGSTAGGGL